MSRSLSHYLLPAAILLPVLLAACSSDKDRAPTSQAADASDSEPTAGLDEGDSLHFTGTEPFWGGDISGGTLTYKTADANSEQVIRVERFAGRGGVSWSGALDGQPFDMSVAPANCSDGMSNRAYPFSVTLKIGDSVRSGCAWSDAKPYSGGPARADARASDDHSAGA